MRDSWRAKLSQFNARTWYRTFSQRSVRIIVINESQQTPPSAKLNTPWKVCPYGIYAPVGLYQKSHSFAGLTCFISDTIISCLNTKRADFPLKYPINQKGTKPRDTMTQFVDLCADSKIRKAAMATGDSRISGLSSRDLVAAEAWYHGQGFMTSRYCDL